MSDRRGAEVGRRGSRDRYERLGNSPALAHDQGDQETRELPFWRGLICGVSFANPVSH